MSHGPEHHIEHAEHATHAAHDGFATKVTISIAIIAAVLAGVTMFAHKAHNDVLSDENKAGIESNMAGDRWAQYQATNVRSHLYDTMSDLSKVAAPAPGKDEELAKQQAIWRAKHLEYESKKLPDIKSKAEEHEANRDKFLADSVHVHHRAEWLDLGELGLQFGIVLCSVAILTKRREYWFVGLLAATIGLLIALGGQFDLFVSSGGHH